MTTAQAVKRNRGGRPKGLPKTGGRKKGTPNKISRDIKQGLLDAYEQLGGPSFFVKLGRSADDRKALASLFGKLLPSQITGAGGGPLEMKLMQQAASGLSKLSDKEIDQLVVLLGKLGLDVTTPGDGQ